MEYTIISDNISLLLDIVNLALAIILVGLTIAFSRLVRERAMFWTWNWIATALVFFTIMEIIDLLETGGWVVFKGLHNMVELLVLVSLVMALVMALRAKRKMFKKIDLP